jgi:hypothetical protein
MSYSVFTDKGQLPEADEIIGAVGWQWPLWESLTDWLAQNYRVKTDFAFLGKNYGWSVRYRRNGKSLVSLYPGKDEFTVLVIISPELCEQAAAMNLEPDTRKTLENAAPYPEGRWLFIRVKSETDLSDARKLIELKSPPLKK